MFRILNGLQTTNMYSISNLFGDFYHYCKEKIIFHDIKKNLLSQENVTKILVPNRFISYFSLFFTLLIYKL